MKIIEKISKTKYIKKNLNKIINNKNKEDIFNKNLKSNFIKKNTHYKNTKEILYQNELQNKNKVKQKIVDKTSVNSKINNSFKFCDLLV